MIDVYLQSRLFPSALSTSSPRKATVDGSNGLGHGRIAKAPAGQRHAQQLQRDAATVDDLLGLGDVLGRAREEGAKEGAEPEGVAADDDGGADGDVVAGEAPIGKGLGVDVGVRGGGECERVGDSEIVRERGSERGSERARAVESRVSE